MVSAQNSSMKLFIGNITLLSNDAWTILSTLIGRSHPKEDVLWSRRDLYSESFQGHNTNTYFAFRDFTYIQSAEAESYAFSADINQLLSLSKWIV